MRASRYERALHRWESRPAFAAARGRAGRRRDVAARRPRPARGGRGDRRSHPDRGRSGARARSARRDGQLLHEAFEAAAGAAAGAARASLPRWRPRPRVDGSVPAGIPCEPGDRRERLRAALGHHRDDRRAGEGLAQRPGSARGARARARPPPSPPRHARAARELGHRARHRGRDRRHRVHHVARGRSADASPAREVFARQRARGRPLRDRGDAQGRPRAALLRHAPRPHGRQALASRRPAELPFLAPGDGGARGARARRFPGPAGGSRR